MTTPALDVPSPGDTPSTADMYRALYGAGGDLKLANAIAYGEAEPLDADTVRRTLTVVRARLRDVASALRHIARTPLLRLKPSLRRDLIEMADGLDELARL